MFFLFGFLKNIRHSAGRMRFFSKNKLPKKLSQIDPTLDQILTQPFLDICLIFCWHKIFYSVFSKGVHFKPNPKKFRNTTTALTEKNAIWGFFCFLFFWWFCRVRVSFDLLLARHEIQIDTKKQKEPYNKIKQANNRVLCLEKEKKTTHTHTHT